MKRPIAFAAFAGAGLLAAGAAAAQAPAPAPAAGTSCRVDTFPLDQRAFGESRVRFARAPAYLARCPENTPACREAVYAVPSELVITGRPSGAFVCVYVPRRQGGDIAGWIQSSRLAPVRIPAAPPLSDWVGHWVSGRNTIDLIQDGDALGANGHAAWPHVFPLPRPKSGGPHYAKFSARTQPSGNRVDFKNGAENNQTLCEVSLVLAGQFLVASDNGLCGGMNVSFTGVYRRR